MRVTSFRTCNVPTWKDASLVLCWRGHTAWTHNTLRHVATQNMKTIILPNTTTTASMALLPVHTHACLYAVARVHLHFFSSRAFARLHRCSTRTRQKERGWPQLGTDKTGKQTACVRVVLSREDAKHDQKSAARVEHKGAERGPVHHALHLSQVGAGRHSAHPVVRAWESVFASRRIDCQAASATEVHAAQCALACERG